MKISLACDHAGYELKTYVKGYLDDHQHLVEDFGCQDLNPVDYPDTGIPAAELVAEGKADFGILICGSGYGMCIAANKVRGIRASLCFKADHARITRQHNNANILVLSGNTTSISQVGEIIDAFFTERFYDEERHSRRLKKIADYEK